MTNELEKQFFDTFGIEPEEEKYCLWECRIPELEHVPCSKECKHQRHDIYYPEITDRILLELICIATSSEITVEFKRIKNVEHLKEVVLNYSIRRYGYCLHKDKFKQQVRTLFEEGNNDR